MRRSPFWAQSSSKEKIYIVGTMVLMVLMMFGHFYSRYVNFVPERGVARIFMAVSLPLAFLHWLPLYRDRHPTNPVPLYSLPMRLGIYSTLFVASFALVCLNLVEVVSPLVTRSFGAIASSEYVVTRKSTGVRVRKDCDHFVWLDDRRSRWIGKICLPEQLWEVVEVGQVLEGSGKRTALGRTIEELSSRSE